MECAFLSGMCSSRVDTERCIAFKENSGLHKPEACTSAGFGRRLSGSMYNTFILSGSKRMTFRTLPSNYRNLNSVLLLNLSDTNRAGQVQGPNTEL